MSILLSVGSAQVTIHPDMYWKDESDWNPVEQSVQRSLTGALIVSVATRTVGRPITLQAEDEASAWMTLANLFQLRIWADTPGQQMQLTISGTVRDVIFRHHEGPAIEAVPVTHYAEMDSTDFYRITLRFMEI